MESEPADPDARAWALRRALDAVAEASVDMPSGEKSSAEALEMQSWHLMTPAIFSAFLVTASPLAIYILQVETTF